MMMNANGKKCYDGIRSQYWCTIALHPSGPKKAEAELGRENLRLSKELEGKQQFITQNQCS